MTLRGFAYAISLILLSCGLQAPAAEAQSIKKARVIASELSGARRSYSYKKISDPTGQAETRRVERFELREGICRSSDCERRPYTRSRIESQNITSLRNGDEAWLLFEVYFPSAEFNQVRHMSTTYGQLFVNYEYPKSWEGSAIWQLKIGDDGRTVQIWQKQVDEHEQFNNEIINVGTLGQGEFAFDRWIDVKVHVTLSHEANGTVTTYLNGQQRARLIARTMTRSGRLEYDYGIYQSGVSDWEAATGKKKSNIPPQVVYYSGVVLGRVQ